MSDGAEDVKFTLKGMINKQKSKVLFAEADSDFVDVLLSFLTLPLGTIVRIIGKHYGDEAPVIGSLTTLYNGLANMNSVHFSTGGAKEMLLNTRSSFETECRKRKLKLSVDDTQPTKYFTCENWNCSHLRYSNIGLYYGTAICSCGKTLNREISVIGSPEVADNGDDGVFITKAASFIICDDLRIAPNVAGSVMETLSNLGIIDMNGAELRNVTFGFNEIMDLLKALFLSRTLLTDIILKESRINDSATPKFEHGMFFHQSEKEETSNSKKMMILKIMVQKSTKKLLFAQAEEDFVDFLFSLLTIPLGGVESLLGGSTSFKSLDNFYMSLSNINGDKYMKTKDTKTNLLNSKLPLFYISSNQILPLTEERTPLLYYCKNTIGNCEYLFHGFPKKERICTDVSYFTCPKGYGSYVKGSRMYMVTDDLTVTPLSVTSTLSVLNGLEIPFSDVEELELHIGLDEALSILKASLTSTSALTISLINPLLKKYVKQEN